MATLPVSQIIGVPVVLPIAGALVKTYTPVAGTDIISTPTSPTFGATSLNVCNVIQTGMFGNFIWNFKQTGAGSAGNGAYRFKTPTGFTINTAISGTETIGNLGAGYCGTITVNDGATENQYSCFVLDSTTVVTRLSGQAGGGGWNAASSTCIFSDAALQFSVNINVPIVEFGSGYLAYGAGRVTNSKDGLARSIDSLSYIKLTRGNGWGSTATAIRRFLSSSVTGVGLAYSDSSTAGAALTCTENGLYYFSYSELFSTANSFGLSVNSSQLTTDIESITAANKIISSATTAATTLSNVSVVVPLVAGDVVRAQTNTGLADSIAPARVTLIAARIF